jgi:iron complex outermembrane receptor protein
MSYRQYWAATLGCFAALATGPLDASAQQTAPVEATRDDEIVVTARRREESLQSTPISVATLNAEQLETRNVANLVDLSISLPNVDIGGSGGLGSANGQFFIRGFGASRNAVTQEPAVALYVDDTYIARSDGALLDVVDVERVEVLRGPQGTLFGRNSTGGAVRYITRKPSNEFETELHLAAGDFDRLDVRGLINIPITDNLAARITAASLQRDGHVVRPDGLVLGDQNSDALRVYVRWAPTPSVEVLFNADYSTIDTNGPASVLIGYNPAQQFVVQEANAGFAITSNMVGDYSRSFGTFANFLDSETIGYGVTVNWDLGTTTLRSISSYRGSDVSLSYDTDASPASLFEQISDRDLKQFSQELQLSGQTFNQRLDWIAGIYYLDEDAFDFRPVRLTANSTPNRSNTRIADASTTSTAIFGQGTFHLTPAWAATLGVRRTRDEKAIDASELSATGALVGAATNEATFEETTGLLSLEYQAMDDLFFYTSYSRGFRSGGFNDRIRTNIPNNGITPYGSETLDSYEVGMRSDWFDHDLRFNLTYFYSTFEDIQLSSVVPGSAPPRTLTDNAGEAEVQGIEGDFRARLGDSFSIDGSFAWLDAHYTSIAPGVTSATLNSEFGRAPEYSYAIGAQYMTDLAHAGRVTARIDWGWKDDLRLTEGDANDITQPAYGLLSSQLRYEAEDGRWSVALFGTNLTDEEYAIGGLDLVGELGIAQVEPGRPREWGIRLDLTY